MQCPNLGEIAFSAHSVQAINEIRRKKELGKLLAVVVSAGHVINIFLGNDALKATYSLQSTDFVAFARAMKAIPDVARAAIYKTATEAWYYSSNHKERQFWQAIASGCGLPE
jgi:hypothetical protein